MTKEKSTILIVPGYADSGSQHWQSRWHTHFSHSVRVIQKDWIRAERDAWVEVLDSFIRDSAHPVILVGHSLGSLAIICWASSRTNQQSISKVQGAFLVAPPDPESEPFRALPITGFDVIPLTQLPFPSILVASENDPFLSLEKARYFARLWGSRLVNIGNMGHIGEDSGLGSWEEGKKLLLTLLA